MCWANKCCFFIKLDLGSVLIGIVSLLFSAVMTVSSAVFLLLDTDAKNQQSEDKLIQATKLPPKSILPPSLVNKVLNIEATLPTARIILCCSLALGLLLMAASISLLVGISKKKPGCVLFYFGFGIFFTIFSQLSGLLLLLEKCWAASLIIFIACCFFIHFLVVVHTIYDDLQKGKKINRFSSRNRLVEDDSVSIIFQENDIE